MNNPGKMLASLLGGLALIALGITLIFMNTTVRFSFYSISLYGYTISSGLLLIPLFISIILFVAMDNKWPGTILFWVSLIALLISLILSLSFNINTTSLFNLVLMFLPVLIGFGLVLRAFIGSGKH